MSDERLNNLEISLAHQAQEISDLNDTVQEQWREIDRLKAALRRAEGKIDEAKFGAENSDEGLSATDIAARDKPPHY